MAKTSVSFSDVNFSCTAFPALEKSQLRCNQAKEVSTSEVQASIPLSNLGGSECIFKVRAQNHLPGLNQRGISLFCFFFVSFAQFRGRTWCHTRSAEEYPTLTITDSSSGAETQLSFASS